MAAHQLSKSTSNSEPPFQIIAVDLNSKRLELANELGAQVTINPGTQSVRDSIMEITQGQGVDAAVDCTGVVSIVEQMVELIASGGIAVTVGGPSPGLKAAIDVFGMLIKCKTYCGSHQGNADSKKVSVTSILQQCAEADAFYHCQFIPWLADLYTSGHFPLERLQTTYRPDKINEACKDMAEGRVLKPILLWD
jgi:aryl-alcohol dehydrogenase